MTKPISIIAPRMSAEAHTLRDFLSRNNIVFEWIDQAPEACDAPLLVTEEGSFCTAGLASVAERIGIRGIPNEAIYDLLIIGGGPAGLAAAVYASSEGLSTAIVEQHSPGGQAGMSSRIENYLGFPGGLSGGELAQKSLEQAHSFGTDMLLTHEACGIAQTEHGIALKLVDDTIVYGHSVIIATGAQWRRLEIPGCDDLTGRGIYYGAALSEAEHVRGEDVYVVGGANSAGQAAVFFANVARRVTMIIRGDSLAAGMSQYLVDRIESTPNIEVMTGSKVTEVVGDGRLEMITVERDEVSHYFDTAAMFIFIGAVPAASWCGDDIARDDHGFILTGADVMSHWKEDRNPLMLETSIPGVFAAGDVRSGSGKRVATAAGEGAMAVMSVWQYRALSGL